MGLFRDQESELPMLRRLVARLRDVARRQGVSAEEWPVAMVAYGLDMSEAPELLNEESLLIYADFVRAVAPAVRLSSLARLASFVSQRRGSGWRALLLYAMGESAHPELCARAATLAITSAAPVDSVVLTGAQEVVQLLAREDAPPAMLGALLSLPDLRFLPTLQPLLSLPLSRLRLLVSELKCSLNSVSSAFLLQLLDAEPSLAEEVTQALSRLAGATSLVADIALPIPTWAYASPTPQPLHAWSRAEYLPRILPRLQPHLSPKQIDSLRAAFV